MIAATDTWTGDTWVTGDTIAELESIAVAPEHRGAGIGTKLLDAVDVELERRGIHRSASRQGDRHSRTPPPGSTSAGSRAAEVLPRVAFSGSTVRFNRARAEEEDDMSDLTDADKNTGLHAFVFVDRVEPERDFRQAIDEVSTLGHPRCSSRPR